MATHEFTTVVHRMPGGSLVILTGEADLSVVDWITDALEYAAKVPPVTVDLSDLSFADSSFLGAIAVARREGQVRIVGAAGPVARVLKIAGLDE